MIIIASDVMVICKKCGNKAPSSTMKLDLDEKLMICPECIKNKKIHKEIKETFITNKPKTFEDVKYAPAEKREESLKSMHKCSYCGYKFAINIETKKPRNCPYCNNEVMAFRFN